MHPVTDAPSFKAKSLLQRNHILEYLMSQVMLKNLVLVLRHLNLDLLVELGY